MAAAMNTPSSITSLPPEILAIIFAASAPRTQSKYAISWEVTISHVCAWWRSVALDTASMWANIEIYSPRCLDRVSNYLERSDSCLVDVWFDLWRTDKEVGQPGWIDPVVDLVVQHIGRWRSLLVFSYNKSTTNAILCRMADLTAPMLQRIRIVDEGEGSSEAVSPWDGRILAGGVPSLVSVQMDRAQYLPLLTNVTTLHLRSTYAAPFKLNTSVLSALAEACPLLTTLSIHGGFNGNDPDWVVGRPPTVAMQSLRHFWVCNDTEDTLPTYFLMTVSLPQLTSLWLDLPYYYLRVLHLLCTHQYRPTFPALKYLTLQSFDFYPTLQAAKIFPTVTTVHFAYCHAFHIPFLRSTLCMNQLHWPHLDTLVFRTSHDSHATKFSGVLRDIFTQRNANGVPIKRLLLDKDTLQSLSDPDSIREVTTLEQLTCNLEDPWWLMVRNAHEDQF